MDNVCKSVKCLKFSEMQWNSVKYTEIQWHAPKFSDMHQSSVKLGRVPFLRLEAVIVYALTIEATSG